VNIPDNHPPGGHQPEPTGPEPPRYCPLVCGLCPRNSDACGFWKTINIPVADPTVAGIALPQGAKAVRMKVLEMCVFDLMVTLLIGAGPGMGG